MWKEFKEFIMRGNVLDLAVGVVVGGAFTSIVTAIVNGLIGPIVAVALKTATGSKDGKVDGLGFKINGIAFDIGMVVSAIIAFFITAFVVFLIVKGVNKVRNVAVPEKEEELAAEEPTPTEVYLKEIRDLLEKQNNQSQNNN